MLIYLRRKISSVAHVLPGRPIALCLLLLMAGTSGHAQSTSIALVQHTSIYAGSTTTSSLAFASPNTALNWIAVAIRAGSSSSQVFTVTDSNGNTYHRALQLGMTGSPITLAIFYAESIKGGANTVTVSDTVSGPFRLAILEYSGVATSNSLDMAATAEGTSTSPNSGSVTTTASGDLLLGEVVTNSTATFTAGASYTVRELVPAEPSTKLIAEDQIQGAAGIVSASATLAASDNWGAGLAAFKAGAGGGGAGLSVTATAGTPQSAVVNTAFATALQVTVKNGNNPVSGVLVTFTPPASGAGGTFAGGANTATTDASGVATSASFTANSTAGGPYNVVASAAGATSANFSLTNLPVTTGGITLVQHTNTDAGSTTTSSLAFASPNTALNWIAVAIRAGSSSSQVFTVTDSNGNTYHRALQLGMTGSPITLAIFYAESIKGGANTVTVSDTVSGPFRLAILEYSGVATSNSLDMAATAEGTSTSPNSGSVTTTASGDLLLGEVVTHNTATLTAGASYTIRELVPAEPSTKLIAEDQIQGAAGIVSASATLAASDNWGAGLAAFKAGAGGGGAGLSVTATAGTPQSAVVNTAFATALQVTVKNGNNPVSGVLVTFTPPASGAGGTFAGGANTATTDASGVATSASFTANSTAGGPYNVVASAAGATSANFSLTNLAGTAPSISTLSLSQGPVGARITITGSNFGATQGGSSVTFNITNATTITWTASSIDVTVPANATTGNVVVTVGGVASNGVPFTVTPPPSITSVNPTSGPVGALVTITGANFGPTVGPISSFVTFNGTQGRSSNWSNTSITIPVPLGATTGNVVVTIGGVVSNGVAFTVTPPPSISGLNPTSGPVGTSVTISGSNFGATQGTNTVMFNGTVATGPTWTDTSIMAPVPTGATTGNVVVAVGGVASNPVNFTVTSTTTGNITLVQHTSRDAGPTTASSLAFASPNTAGNWIAVGLRAGNSNAQVFTVTDSNGNTYHSALQLGSGASNVTFAIFYAENIKGGANTVNVSDTVSGPFRFAIMEYSGVATSNSLELAATAQGNSAIPNSGSATTTSSGDLLLAAIVTQNPAVFTGGSGYTVEESVPAEPSTKLIVEDQLQRSAGSASASATLAASDNWGAGFAAFRSASGVGLPLSVTVSPAIANVATGSGTQSFTAALVNDFQHQGATWSLSGAGCSGNTCGTLSNATSTSVTYTGPANIPNPATVTLTATAVADKTKTGTATITVTQGVLTVSVSPKRSALTTSQTQQFTATVANGPSGVTWSVDGNTGGNTTTGTVSSAGVYTPGTQPGVHTVTATSVANASVNASSTVAVTDLAGVYTYHYDTARTGENLKEYALTTTNVNASTFGALFTCPVDGYVWAAPLYVANLTIGTQTHNVVFVATSHNSVYAFDADSSSCVHFWTTSFLSSGVTTVSTGDVGDAANDMFPEIGVTSTPVLDPATSTIYVEAKTKDTVSSGCSTSTPCFFHHLHALDMRTGTEKLSGPVVISAHNFVPQPQHQRPALLLSNGTVYIGFGSHGDRNTYHAWVMGYDATNLTQKFATPLSDPTTSGNRGAVWQGGAGPALDASGNVYVSTGNGIYDGSINFGDSTVKLSPTGAILDWFTPFNQSVFNANDIDLGSAGVIILPDSVGSSSHPHLALATGKVSILYLLDQNNMGKFNSSTNNDVQEVIPVPPPNTTLLDGGIFGSSAYWNGNIYSSGVSFPLSQFTISNGSISTPAFAVSSNNFPLRGATPVVSASGTTNGIVWILDLGAWSSNGPAILDAYDATNVSKLLFSSPSSGSGAAGPAVKFTVPTVANGKVYVGGEYTLTVFGLLPN